MDSLVDYYLAVDSELFVSPSQWELILRNRPMDYNLLEGLCLFLIDELKYATGQIEGYRPLFTYSAVEECFREWSL